MNLYTGSKSGFAINSSDACVCFGEDYRRLQRRLAAAFRAGHDGVRQTRLALGLGKPISQSAFDYAWQYLREVGY